MYHKISSMCDKIRVIYDKSEQLRIMKYGHPDDPNFKKSDKSDIDFLIKDIQTLCREIANDKGKYNKYPAKKNA
tara:strand:- start:109 stop:330 length:222 start_codon:yes stop_codon:yes gene_type:complete